MIPAIVFMVGLSLALSMLLAIASRVFYVREDPRLEAVKHSQLATAPDIFAAGDLTTGQATVISAVAGGLPAQSIIF